MSIISSFPSLCFPNPPTRRTSRAMICVYMPSLTHIIACNTHTHTHTAFHEHFNLSSSLPSSFPTHTSTIIASLSLSRKAREAATRAALRRRRWSLRLRYCARRLHRHLRCGGVETGRSTSIPSRGNDSRRQHRSVWCSFRRHRWQRRMGIKDDVRLCVRDL